MTYTLAKSLREVFDDTPEIMSWFNEDTYAAAEARAHINGMREMMKEAADRIERLETALQEIAATPIGSEVPDRTTIWGLAMHMHWVAKDALKEKKND